MKMLTFNDILFFLILSMCLFCTKKCLTKRLHTVDTPTFYKNVDHIDTIGHMKYIYIKEKCE